MAVMMVKLMDRNNEHNNNLDNKNASNLKEYNKISKNTSEKNFSVCTDSYVNHVHHRQLNTVFLNTRQWVLEKLENDPPIPVYTCACICM